MQVLNLHESVQVFTDSIEQPSQIEYELSDFMNYCKAV